MSRQVNSDVQLEYVMREGMIYHVNEFENCPKPYPFMTCPECGDQVVPVLGPINAHHARHKTIGRCTCESPEHSNAKYKLFIHLLNTTELNVWRKCDECGKSEKSTFCNEWDQVLCERRIEKYTPDISLIYKTGHPVAIEVFHTHAIPNEKINWFREKEIIWIEVHARVVLAWNPILPLPLNRISDSYWRCVSCEESAKQQEANRNAAIKPTGEIKFDPSICFSCGGLAPWRNKCSYHNGGVKVNPDWAIQWSRKHSLWHCVYCRAVSKNKDYDSIIHDIKATDRVGNLIQHSQQCKFWAYLEAQKVKEIQL